MLFVFSAGNSGEYCLTSEYKTCSFVPCCLTVNGLLGVQDSEAYIWVGSLTDDGSRISRIQRHSAGDMGADFIVAHDDVLSAGDTAGTSFGSARIRCSGLDTAQISWLSGFQLKQLLLSTAQDIGEPGIDPIFGHGKLDPAMH